MLGGLDVDSDDDFDSHFALQSLNDSGDDDRLPKAIEVQNAGTKLVNGIYKRLRNDIDGTASYQYIPNADNQERALTLYRRTMDSGAHQWYISIVANSRDPGTNYDVDFYFALSATSSKAMESPPLQGWQIVARNSESLRPPPTLSYIEDLEEMEVDEQKGEAFVKLKQIAESWQNQTGILMRQIDQCLEQEQARELLQQKKVAEVEGLNIEKQALQAANTQQSEKISEMEKQLKGLNEKQVENSDIFKAIPKLTDKDKLASFSLHKLLALEQLLETTVARVKDMKIELEKRDNSCVVCLEAAKTVLLLPCQHLCLCIKCSEKCLDSCPLCRNAIQNKINVFTS